MNQIVYKSIFDHLSNTELEWSQGDTQDRYENNLKKQYSELDRLGWLDKKFTYKLNSQGFRSDEFSKDDSIMFLGCSYTFGTGLPLENTFAHIVSTRLNLKCYNLGQPGGSNDTTFRLAYGYIPKLKPKIVVLNTIQHLRLELISKDSNNNPNLILNYLNTNSYDGFSNFYNEWIYNDVNTYMNYQKNLLAIKQLCLNFSCKFIETDSLKMIVSDSNEGTRRDRIELSQDFARDLQHPGVKCNLKYANKILSLI